jgi:maltooligosyltrehalose trehalohydrolase
MQRSGATTSIAREFPIGAECLADGGVHFRVWAPRPKRVEVVLRANASSADEEVIELTPEENGYYSGLAPQAKAGMQYGFRLNGDARLLPDPASRYQPDGPAGLSQIVDPRQFAWTDQQWKGRGATGQVLYEMHIGTFTQEGSWTAAARELPELARLGITTIEVMPVAEFPGRFGWGYDGVNMFAPTRLYGPPDAMRRFVDTAHANGINVILDVVYNHFGISDNYLLEFSEHYHTDRHDNEWGDAINFDGEDSTGVRDFFESNARYWINEFHVDGYRFDATQAIHDSSEDHILRRLARAARQAAEKRSIYLTAENEPQDVRHVRPAEQGGHGMDAIWNDDFHHTAHVRLTAKNSAYYSDYTGRNDEFIAALKYGFLYQGQRSQWQKKPRGSPTRGLPATAFVIFLENHDQVANSAAGARIHQLSSPGRHRAMTALWLLAPQTPLFFQGQEFSSSAPFLYFADFSGALSQEVTNGRLDFLSQFPELATPEARAEIAPPADPATFERSKLNFAERESHSQIYQLHVDLLKLKREDPVFRRQRADLIDAASLSPDCFVVRYFGDDADRLLIVNFGPDLLYAPIPQPLLAPPAGMTWSMLWSSELPRYGGSGAPTVETEEGWRISGESAIVLEAVTPKEESAEKGTA